MTRLKLLPLLLLVGFCSLSYSASNEDIEEQCPQHCHCEHTLRFGTNVKCSKITKLQNFQDPVTSFTLERDVDDTAEPLELPRKFFLELGNSFKHVDSMLITVDIVKIDPDAFHGLNGLASLNISNNGLTYIHPDTFFNNTGLRQLALTRNPLQFGEYILNSRDLLELDLSFCQIRNLSENAFVKLTELAYLNLESNLIDTIHPMTFEPLLLLEELHLTNNKLRTLNPNVFLKNEELNTLMLGYNPLASIENVQLPGIQQLHLQHCTFTELNSTTFSAYIGLTNLNLSGNSIQKLSTDTFSKLEVLMHLDISNNRLGSLDSMLFSGNQGLETLSLRDNPTIKLWPEEGFQGQLNQLYFLDVSNTGIQSLALGSLKNMSNLARLDLSRNALKSLEKGVLPEKIKFLSLAHNAITSIDDINVSSKNRVHQLFLQGNKIKYLTQNNFDNLPYLSRLDVSSCELETIWLEKQTGEQKIKRLRQLNLSKNKLQKILPNDLNVFSNLDVLDIRGNPLVCSEDLETLINYLRNSSIEPVAFSNLGTIDEHLESFKWDDIMTNNNCDSPQKSPQKPSEKLVQESNVPKILKFLPKMRISSDERESILYDTYEDIISSDDPEFQDDTDNYQTTRIPHHKSVLTPRIVEVSDTSPVLVAFLSAVIMTLIITLLLALFATMCKQRFVSGIDIWKRPHRERSSSYRPLHEHEQLNLPNTPIVKIKAQPTEIGVNSKNDSYIRNVNNGTYSSTDFHHSNITPQTV